MTDDFDDAHMRTNCGRNPRAARWVLVGVVVFWAVCLWLFL